jgi:hypothetical protein
MTILREEKVRGVLSPLVQPPETCERTMKIALGIVGKVIPAAQPGQLSTISGQQIENAIDVSAFALCWYLAALRDPVRRDLLTKHLLDKVFTLICAVEAAGISIKEGINMIEALRRVDDNVKRAGALAKHERHTSPAVKRRALRRRSFCSQDVKQTAQQQANATTTEMRSLPPLFIPSFTWAPIPKHRAEQVAHLLGDIDAETRPGNVSTSSDETIEELARASHLAFCWLLGSLGDTRRADQIALPWLEWVPFQVDLTCAVATADQPGDMARQVH